MFLWSKLVAITSTIITSGAASSFLVPYFKGQNLTDWLSRIIYKKDSSKVEFNFEELDKESNSRIEKLDKWFKKLSASEAIANTWKKIEFAKIQKLFENIANAEKELIQIFEKISSSLSSLIAKNKKFFEISEQKLVEEKEEKLQHNISKNYALLQEALNRWEKSLNEITCAIDNKGESEQANGCNKQSLISSIVNSTFSFFSLFSKEADEATSSTTNGNNAQGGEKAKKELEEIKQSLLKEIKQLRERNSVFKLLQANATAKEIVSSLKYVYYSSILKVLSSQQESLQSLIKQEESEANKKIKSIRGYQKHLIGHHKQYSSLQKQEAIFHNWKEIFKERILINESNKNREVTLIRKKQK